MKVLAVALLAAASHAEAGAQDPERAGRAVAPAVTHGPFLGHTTPTTADVWARMSRPGRFTLTAHGGSAPVRATASAALDGDLCVVFGLVGLSPDRAYRCELELPDDSVRPASVAFTTPPLREDLATLAFGSCAHEDAATASVWSRMRALEPDAVVLLGDTPYIDSTNLLVQRRRYGEIARVGELAGLLATTPWYATWDDHDFGANDTNGLLPGKEHSRRAFVEYHANPSYGDGVHGVYTSFRRGGVEVFLLDTRWFAATEPSPAAPGQPTLLGKAQWDWLRRGLLASTATFKILASGMIWNGAVRPGKLDHWETYAHERDALFRFIGSNRISGVVLVGGDVHRSRVVRHATRSSAGYELTELITSPMHGSVIAAANAPHPGLVADFGEPRAFLLVTVDTRAEPGQLEARIVNAAGRELFALVLRATELGG